MLTLYAISIVCFAVLIGACFAIVRHVRADTGGASKTTPPEPSFAEHMEAAVRYGSVRKPRLVPQQTVEGITAKKAWNRRSQAVEVHPSSVAPEQGQRAAFSPARSDWEHFNKDYGDLTDPHPSRPVRTASRNQ